tara:strand:+ start:248 stop:535 length:288 start_codon:yes stop_codon:yes gene_type:complete
MKPIRITFYNYNSVEIIAQNITYQKKEYFKEVKKIYNDDGFYHIIYKQVKRISKKQCIEWIKGNLLSVGGGDFVDYNYTDEDYKLAQELIEKYNL